VCKRLLIGVLAATLAAGPAGAAQGKAHLTSTNGKVLVNKGDGFIPPSSGMLLNAGDKIFVGHEASAAIRYVADDCQVAVSAHRVVTIEVLSPCQNKTVQVQPAADLPEEAVAEVPAFNPALLLIPIGVGVGLCIAFCDGDGDSP
jgi:hypothetical protein